MGKRIKNAKAKHGLNSKFDLRQNLVSNWEREKRRERGEERKKMDEQKGMELLNFSMDLWFV